MTRPSVLILWPLVLAGSMFIGCRRHPASSGGASGSTARPVNVIVGKLEPRVFEERLEVQGTVKAVRYANIAARIPGTLDELPVAEGDAVRPGQILFQTERINLENTVEVQRQELAVARASVTEAEAGVRQKLAASEKAALDAARFRKLYENDRAVTRDAFERMESARKQAEAGVDYAKALVTLAKAREAQATSALKIALKRLADSRVSAPFSGRIVRKFREKGEFAGAGTAVVRLEALDDIEVSFFVDAAQYSRVMPDETRAVVSAAGRRIAEAPVSWRAPVVDPATRTFEVKVRLAATGALVPGMLCDVRLILASHQGMGLPRRAIRQRAGAETVFAVDGAVARAVSVHTGLTTGEMIEIADPEKLAGKQIVIEGQTFLEDGGAVRIVGNGRPARPQKDALRATTPEGRSTPR
ncbi:MAG: efflux RND transporter periplasmic adaptor subunit [Kiritimatiellaeota bacterium]|nr:efflux RND transporter periplasmic adaptor subunit [Kiritimatiellota bacterium]